MLYALQHALLLSMRCSVHYPRLADRFGQIHPDSDIQKLILEWGDEQVKCGESIAALIIDLGSQPMWVVDCREDEFESPDFFLIEKIRQSKAVDTLNAATKLAIRASHRSALRELINGAQARLDELTELDNRIDVPTSSRRRPS